MRPETLRTLGIVAVDTAGAFLLAILLSIVLLVATALLGSGLADVTTAPLARAVAWELTVDGVADPGARALLRDVQAALPEDPARRHFELQERRGTVWLAARLADRSEEGAIRDRVRASGLWTGSVTVGRNWERWMEDLATRPAEGLSQLATTTPALLFLSVGGVAFLLAGLGGRRLRPVPGYEAPPPPWRRSLILGVTLGLGTAVLSALASLLSRAVGLEVQEQAWVKELAGGSTVALAALAAVAVVVAPLGEELFFRGHLFRYVTSEIDARAAYAVTAVVFSAIHLNPGGTPSYVVAAVAMGWAYHRWRCLRVPVLAHATYNASAVALLVLLGG